MNLLTLRTPIALCLAVGGGSVAFAQDTPAGSGITGPPPQGASRIEVGLAFAQTVNSSNFNATESRREYAEEATFNSAYALGGGPGGALDLQYNLSERFGVRMGAQTFSRKSAGTFDAQIPHPFFFSQPRAISGTESGLDFSETAYSLTAVLRGGSGKWRVSVEGGPAYFSVNATVAEKINFTDVYPFDTATFSGIVSSKHKASPFGFAVGIEVGRQITPSVSLVAQGRFTQGSGELDVNGRKISIKPGGAQARLGLRFVLARKRAGS